ncbi:hypothetical protein GEOBRER4_n1257 [Citrifermentans bremense]|uniref:Uncharacterized protein n=1 Tax=Citrifermentans bremense TaxID=60035 RepID=A0A7R7FS63_9BACT|nr:hypothetical protein GEOBRER4_n1257 [Citrifermentans bremense]
MDTYKFIKFSKKKLVILYASPWFPWSPDSLSFLYLLHQ